MRPIASIFFAAALGAVALFAPSTATAAPHPITIDAWVRAAAHVVHARVQSAEGNRFLFWVLADLKGRVASREIHASLGTSSCIGPPPGQGLPPPRLPAGTEVVLFLGPPAPGGHPVVDGGLAWLKVGGGGSEVPDAVRSIVALEALPAPEARTRGYLAAVESPNATLRQTARQVLAAELDGKEKTEPWEDELAVLIWSPVQEARLAALHALRFSASEKALPALLEAVGDGDRTVRECASMALASYDTEATVARLLAAAGRSEEMAKRVIVDLRTSRRPEARAALVGFLVSSNPEIRRLAAGSFYRRVFDGDPVIGDLHRLVDDPVTEVRVAALDALHKSPLPGTVGVLAGALRRRDLAPAEARAAVRSLGTIAGGVTNHRELRPAFRDVPDLPSLLEKTLGMGEAAGPPPLGHSVVGILGASGTEDAKALLQRMRAGEFGREFMKEAGAALEWIDARKEGW